MNWSGYPRYRDSGVEWIGELPIEWAVSPVKRAYQLQLGKMLQPAQVAEKDFPVPYVKALHVQWGSVDTEDLPDMWASPADIEQYGVRKGDLLVCEGGEVGRSSLVGDVPEGCIIQNSVHRVRPHKAADLSYLLYSLHAVDSSGWLDVLCNKATIGHFTREKFADLRVPLPSHSEQRTIAAFLDRETARIDALIARKQRQIELLQEKRQAVITQAVTRGLDPNVPIKDSGVQWIEEIPTDWEVKRLKYISPHITVGIVVTPAKFYVAVGVPCLRSLNVRDGSLTDNDLVFISPESHQLHAKSRLRVGDIVAVRSGRPGSTAVVDLRYDGANCIDLIIIRRSPTFESQFLAYAMASQCVRSQFEAGSEGAIQQHFNIETANSLLIALPPLKTQIAIRSTLDQQLADLRALEESIARSVATLVEFRTALISAAVTGKIDVRDTAAVQRPAAPLPFRRAVLGAEIIQRLQDDPHFGRTKFEKALYLCEHHLGMELEGTYWRKAAGPLDGRMLYGMETMLARQKWYGVDESAGRVRYVPLEKAGAHEKYFERYWGQHQEALDAFLALFSQLNTERCEIVATLHAAWNDLLLAGAYFTDADIIREVRERWHERKERFTEDRLQRALGWMRKQGLMPGGRGRPTLFDGTDAATGEPA